MCIAMVCFPGSDVINVEINPSFLTEKLKIEISQEQKELLR